MFARRSHDVATIPERQSGTRNADCANRNSIAGLVMGGNGILPRFAVAMRTSCLFFISIVPPMVQCALTQRPRYEFDLVQAVSGGPAAPQLWRFANQFSCPEARALHRSSSMSSPSLLRVATQPHAAVNSGEDKDNRD